MIALSLLGGSVSLGCEDRRLAYAVLKRGSFASFDWGETAGVKHD